MSRTCTFNVTLSQTHILPVSMQYATADKTAFAGKDFTSVSGTLTFAPGETTKAIAVPVQAVSDRDLTMLMRIFNPTNGTLAGSSSGKATIQKDNALVALVNAYKTAKANSIAASDAAVSASAAKDDAQAAYDAAAAVAATAAADATAKDAVADAAEAAAASEYSTYQYLLALSFFNPAYAGAAAQSQANYQAKQSDANQKRAIANAALDVSNQKEADRVATQTALIAATTANTTAQAAATAASAAMETARATAAAAFVGSTTLEV